MKKSNGARPSPRFDVSLFAGRKQPAFDEIEGLLTIQEVADLLSLSISGIRKLVARRVLPVYKISRQIVRFRRSEVEAAINRYRVKEVC